MKKAAIISGAVTGALVVLFFSAYFILTAPRYAGDFSAEAFAVYLENGQFQTDKQYGEITDFKSAAAVGKTAISQHFDEGSGSVFKWMGCSVQYDKENDAYYVRTFRLNPRVLGGAYDVILRSDGTVLAIWGEK